MDSSYSPATASIPASNIVLDVQHELSVEITYSKAFRAKEFALEAIYGTHEEAYKAMPKYTASLEETNPNSIVRLDVTAENQFNASLFATAPVQSVLLIVILFLDSMVPTSRRDIKGLSSLPLVSTLWVNYSLLPMQL